MRRGRSWQGGWGRRRRCPLLSSTSTPPTRSFLFFCYPCAIDLSLEVVDVIASQNAADEVDAADKVIDVNASKAVDAADKVDVVEGLAAEVPSAAKVPRLDASQAVQPSVLESHFFEVEAEASPSPAAAPARGRSRTPSLVGRGHPLLMPLDIVQPVRTAEAPWPKRPPLCDFVSPKFVMILAVRQYMAFLLRGGSTRLRLLYDEEALGILDHFYSTYNNRACCVDPLFSRRLLARHSSKRRLYRPGDGRRFDVEVALAGRLPAERPDLLVGLPRRRKRQPGASVRTRQAWRWGPHPLGVQVGPALAQASPRFRGTRWALTVKCSVHDIESRHGRNTSHLQKRTDYGNFSATAAIDEAKAQARHILKSVRGASPPHIVQLPSWCSQVNSQDNCAERPRVARSELRKRKWEQLDSAWDAVLAKAFHAKSALSLFQFFYRKQRRALGERIKLHAANKIAKAQYELLEDRGDAQVQYYKKLSDKLKGITKKNRDVRRQRRAEMISQSQQISLCNGHGGAFPICNGHGVNPVLNIHSYSLGAGS